MKKGSAGLETVCLDDIKQRQFDLEEQYLSPYATKSNSSLGREKPLDSCLFRTDFQRDKDRILHSKAFRRLKHKTQVFFSPEDDHYRTRLTHTLEVSQVSRTLARALRLNEDLTEAIALGHDLGHTPFGHTGEETLNRILDGGFRHNEQSVRTAQVIEDLNLTKETVDGILNHSMGDHLNAFTLEGQAVKLSDKIAYLNHDLDDAIRAGILSLEDLPKEVLDYLGSTRGQMVNKMVQDIVQYSYEKDFVKMSPECNKVMLILRKWMFKNVYFDGKAKEEEHKIKRIIKELFNYYIELLNAHDPQATQEEILVVVTDHIAMMTDRYAVKEYRKLFLPRPMTVSVEDNTILQFAKLNGIIK